MLAGFGRLLLDAFGLASGSVRALIGGHATHSAISVPIKLAVSAATSTEAGATSTAADPRGSRRCRRPRPSQTPGQIQSDGSGEGSPSQLESSGNDLSVTNTWSLNDQAHYHNQHNQPCDQPLHDPGTLPASRLVEMSPSADLQDVAVISRAIHDDDQRPLFVYRSKPQQSDDSGWTATAGEGEADLTTETMGVAHLRHLIDRWPELTSVLSDPREISAWEWDEAAGHYREVQPPDEFREVSRQ